MSELSGQVAIVTGGASGIGAASVKLLAEAGASVISADIQQGPADAPARFVEHDVTSEDSWKALLADVLGRESRLDIVVNNAGITGGGGWPTVETTTVEQWRRVEAVNSEGVFLGCKYAIEGMKKTGPDKPLSKGSIVNVSSIAALIGSAGPAAYVASKGAVRLLSKSVALYCAEQKYGIRCNSVHPGGVDTPIFNPLWQAMGHEQGKALLGARHPIGRMAEPQDLGEVILWLASDRSSFVTGAELVADGAVTSRLTGRAAVALENKVVLVSGGASGIGAETARRVVREGGKAVLADRDEARGRALAGELGGSALFVPLDVTDEPAWQTAVASTVETFGGLHGLLNAAGVGVRNSIEDCSLEEYRRVNDINSMGTFLGCKHAIPAMRETIAKQGGGGSIVNISSVLGLRGASYAMAYCASKGAVRSLTKNVAMHGAPMNIRCNSVHPGYIDTPMIAPRLEVPIGNMSGRQWLEELHPLGRLGRAEEVANMILFLLSDESTFSTGSEFVCDGGLTA